MLAPSRVHRNWRGQPASRPHKCAQSGLPAGGFLRILNAVRARALGVPDVIYPQSGRTFPSSTFHASVQRVFRQGWCLLVGLLLLVGPAWADDEAEFVRHPSAAVAERVARAALARNQVGKAMNWAERMLQAPGTTLEQMNWVGKVRSELKWRLPDAGLGQVVLKINPAKADVIIDGTLVPHHTASHTLWLPAGSHALEVISGDYTTVTLSISARVGEREFHEIALDPSKLPELIFHVTPDAEIILNGAPLGPSTRIRYEQPSGNYTVVLRAPGYETWTQQIRLVSGKAHHIDVQLKPSTPPRDPREERRAHQIDRPLLPIEVADKADRHTFKQQVKSNLDRALGNKVAADAATPKSQREAREKAADSAVKPTVVDAEKFEQSDAMARDAGASGRAPPLEDTARAADRYVADAVAAKPEGNRQVGAGRPEAEAETAAQIRDEPPTAPSTPWSRSTKGWIYGGAGAAVVGAGLAWAYLGTLDAEAANQEKRGSKTYADNYAAAAQKTYVGYAVAGAGAVGLGLGAYYLFGDGGLSRRGKGWVLGTVGTVTAAVGGWMMFNAAQAASETDTLLTPTNPEYTRRFDLAERDRWIGLGLAGVGVGILTTGIVLMVTDRSSSARAEPTTTPALAQKLRWQVSPWLANSGAARTTGASLRVDF